MSPKNKLSSAVPDKWNQLIEEFRSFGGIANNIVQRKGTYGLGLFPINPEQNVEIHIPESLLVSTQNIKLHNNKIKLKDHSVHPRGFGEWYEKFQANYSWGAEAQLNIRNFEGELKALPSNLITSLENLGLYNSKRFFSSNPNQNTFERFIQTRQIGWEGRLVLMPILELVNHSPIHPSWLISKDGISVKGIYKDEILVRYSVSDPLRRFFQYGFNCREITGFSLNVNVLHKNKTIIVQGGDNRRHLKLPRLTVNQNTITIHQPLLGCFFDPAQPRTLFRKVFKRIDNIDSDELFDQICHQNRIKIISLIQKFNNMKGSFAIQLQEACLQQLNIISYHCGKK